MRWKPQWYHCKGRKFAGLRNLFYLGNSPPFAFTILAFNSIPCSTSKFSIKAINFEISNFLSLKKFSLHLFFPFIYRCVKTCENKFRKKRSKKILIKGLRTQKPFSFPFLFPFLENKLRIVFRFSVRYDILLETNNFYFLRFSFLYVYKKKNFLKIWYWKLLRKRINWKREWKKKSIYQTTKLQ